MKWFIGIAVLSLSLASSAWAGEGGGFDPDRPFNQAFSNRILESLFSQALEALEDHFEISGNLNPDSPDGDRTKKLQFKFYPEGKSKSKDHVTAEGWFGPSKDSREEELHFRFVVPKSSSEPSPEPLSNVL
jgi:hypothetical protein